MKKKSRRIIKVFLILIAILLVLWLIIIIISKIRFKRDKAFLEEKGYSSLVSAGEYAVNVDSEKIGIIGICGWGGMAINTASLDTRIKATAAITMYDMTRVNAKGYFDSEDSEEKRYEAKKAMCAQRLEDLKSGEYKRAGGVVDPLPEDAPFFVKDYYDYYKTNRGYHVRSLNSNDGWNVIGCESFVNQPILKYSNEIRSAVLIVHGEKAHSCYFSKDAYADMINGSKYTDNKELMIIPNAVHTDLYDGGNNNYIPYDKLESFFSKYLK